MLNSGGFFIIEGRLSCIVKNNKETATHEEFFEKLLEIEMGHREAARTNRLIKNANSDVIKKFENYDFTRVTLPASSSTEVVRSGKYSRKTEFNFIWYRYMCQRID